MLPRRPIHHPHTAAVAGSTEAELSVDGVAAWMTALGL